MAQRILCDAEDGTYGSAHANGHAYPTGAALDDLHAKVWSFLMVHPRP